MKRALIGFLIFILVFTSFQTINGTSNKMKNSDLIFQTNEIFINDETENVVCRLRPFYENNEEVRNRLIQLLSPIGLPSVINNPMLLQ